MRVYRGFSHMWYVIANSSWTQHQGSHAATGKEKQQTKTGKKHFALQEGILWAVATLPLMSLWTPREVQAAGKHPQRAQSLHSDKNCRHYKDIRVINSTRSNINPKGIPKLASPEEQTSFLKKHEFFLGEGDEYVFLIYYTFSYILIYRQLCYHLAFLRIFVI